MVLCLCGIGSYSAFGAWNSDVSSSDFDYTASVSDFLADAPADTTALKFPVSKTSIQTYEDLTRQLPADLKNPSNLKTSIEYDEGSNSYVFRTKVGNSEVSTPFMLNADEYKNYSLQKSIAAYYREKNAESFAKGVDEFNFLDMKFNIGPLDKIFGPGGVQIKTQGSAELTFGLKTNKIDNPTLPLNSRKKTYFDFDQKIQANINAKVGDKLNFSMNYNTDATFDFDSQKLKLQYEGKEDEIIKNIEAGNVSMTTGSSLIKGSAALFGVKTTLQFGKLTATALISQQESESKTINTKGGAQTTSFEITADQYDENRHFFLAHYFRDNYDRFMSKLPKISSGVTINRVEIWVTNKQAVYNQSRNIVAFMDLGENEKLASKHWTGGSSPYPSNNSNNLYNTITTDPRFKDARDINKVTQVLEVLEADSVIGGRDYVKLESARKLEESEYTVNKQLGYVSLKSGLKPDDVLAVSFDYTMGNQTFQVGEFSSNIENTDNALFLKLLKGTTINTELPMWDLMMKNVYSLNAYQVQKDKFRLDVLYLSDTTGIMLNYLPIPNVQNETLLRLLNLDRLNSNLEPSPDGIFDFVDGYTVLSQNGRIIFPVVEPFGSYLSSKKIPDKYVFQELYDQTLTMARQNSEKNKFSLRGEYRSSSGAEIQLNAMNVPRGSVIVTAGGKPLVENADYTVDYLMGVVTITNPVYIESGTPISVSLENRSMFNLQRKTMLGLDLNYAFSKNFNLGATVMHLSERPMTEKVNMGDEVLNNTLWGLNTAYNTEFQWLTNWIDKLPMVSATAPSRLSVMAEFAQLVPGKPSKKKENGISYIDDFENSQTGNDIRTPADWSLSSTPSFFKESKLSNDIKYGFNRALLSWYYIDRLFTQKNSSLTPAHLKNDLDQLSNHYVREISTRELFPNKELKYGESSTMQVLNLSYYPTERGPYNMDADSVDYNTGALLKPETRWGGMMSKMRNPDFEATNIEYIQFWLLDPFIYDKTSTGGDLYFNFGEISEDILKDGLKSFENGLPVDGDESQIALTNWGKVSKRQSMAPYGFEKDNREKQDVGLDGLSNDEEFSYKTYGEFVEKLRNTLSDQAQAEFNQNPFSPFRDPAGDNYHYFRGADYDNQQLDILSRYKHFNGVEGNSSSSDNTYDAAKSTPDVEDINADNTLNEYERYYQYKVSINPNDLAVGKKYVTDKRTAIVKLRNGSEEEVNWYQFKIPLDDSDKEKVGSIQDFKSIRFARMFLTGFKKEVHLRFASLELVRGEWRTYTEALSTGETPSTGKLDVSVVNIEQNAGQVPVNYVLPPGVTRVIDPGQAQIAQANEQAMTLKVTDLPGSNARAVYKNTHLDMRLYKRLQMFVHAESFIENNTQLQNGDLAIFIRMGTDQRSNYYEYEIPLDLTPEGFYNTYKYQDQLAVWPAQNMFDFPLNLWTNLKLKRNNEIRHSNASVSYQKQYSIYDPDKIKNRISIVGNPSLSDVRTIVIGVRNRTGSKKDAVIWVNELRLTDFDEEGGWAAKANVNLSVSDIATVNVGGQVETIGFGGIDQKLNERRLDDYYQYNVATMIELGRFLPEKVKLKAPLFYSLTEQRLMPKYNPIDQDILLKDALNAAQTTEERDSIKDFAQERFTVKSFSISGLKFDIQSKTPMPYDPANFSLSYSSNRQNKKDPSTMFENTSDYRGNFTYSYSPYVKPFTPFAFIKSKSKHLKVVKEFGINYLPSNISFYTNLSRYYYEQKLRDFTAGAGGLDLPVNYSKNFLWDRQFAIQWNLLKSLNLSLNTMTNARVDEPDGPVNKRLFPDEYADWKESVMQSVLDLGTPWNYTQQFNGTFTVPLNKIPVLDWTTLSVKYSATYGWDRGVFIDAESEMGNNINNQAQMGIDGRINLESLYNKSKFLKNVNRKFANTNRPSVAKKPETKKKYDQKVRLKADTTTTIKHNLDNKKLKVSAKNYRGEYYPIKYKVVDKNTIRIETQDTAQVQLSILQGKRPEETVWYKAAEYGSRFAMMVRNVNVRYSKTNSMFVPAFRPNVGDVFGQSNGYDVLAPGLDFAFGFTDESYLKKLLDRNWLIVGDSTLVNPAVTNMTEEFQFDATLEPVRGLKITLNALRSKNSNKQVQFMFDDMPMVQGGNFTMTHIAIRTSLKQPDVKNGYQSKAFSDFLNNRGIIASRLQNTYSGISKEGSLPGTLNDVSQNSSDVLIPAFLAAYSGKDAGKIGLTAFPSLSSLLPNWRVTYDGLIQIPFLRNNLKSITLSHAYRCTYSVGSYSSYLGWTQISGDLGYTGDITTGNLLPSSPFDISSVSITESFAPLFGIDVTFKNNVTTRFEFKDTRNLSLNTGSGQIVEAMTRDITVGAGYKIANFNAVITKKGGGQVGFNNDLTFRADFSFKNTQALIRRIEQNFTQATSGTQSFMFKFSADYGLSKFITLRAFYDKQINTPLVSSTSYPVSNSSFGLSIRLSLTR